MKKLPLYLLSLGMVFMSNNANADPFTLIQLGYGLTKGAIDARKAQVNEARNRNMSASFFSAGTDQCIEPVGSVRIVEPEQQYWVSNLPSPTRILSKVIDDSSCFTIVDRGIGFSALQKERELALAGGLSNAESLSQAKIRGADYILVPGIVIENANTGGKSINLAGDAHDLVGNSGKGSLSYQSGKKKAEVILTLMDVRTSEQVLSMLGEAKVSDKQYSLLLSGKTIQGQGSAGISGWGHTGMDEVLRDAYEDAYKRMITEIGNKNLISRLDKDSGEVSGKLQKAENKSFTGYFVSEILKPKAEPNKKINSFFSKNKNDAVEQESFTVIRLARLYEQPDIESPAVVEIKKGLNVYSLGKEENNMINVQNELGKAGWISKIHLQSNKN